LADSAVDKHSILLTCYSMSTGIDLPVDTL